MRALIHGGVDTDKGVDLEATEKVSQLVAG